MSNWKEIFEESRRSSALCAGRTKIPTANIVNIPITLQELDIVEKNDGYSFCVMVAKEYPDSYIFGGRYVTQRFESLMNIAGMNLKEFNDDLRTSEFNMKLVTRTSNNKNAHGAYNVYTDMEVI